LDSRGILGDVVSTLDNAPFLPLYLSAPADRKNNSLPKGFFYRLVGHGKILFISP
jgi:hypothetical protein